MPGPCCLLGGDLPLACYCWIVALVTCADLAREIGVTEGAVRLARRLEPARMRTEEGFRYDRDLALTLWTQRRRAPTRTGEESPITLPAPAEEGDPLDERAANARARVASARLAELRYATEVRQLVPLDEAVETWGRALSQIRALVMAVPSQLRHACPEGTPALQIIDRAEAMLRDALTRASEVDLDGPAQGKPTGD